MSTIQETGDLLILAKQMSCDGTAFQILRG
jgi:hypothetical protein